VVLDSARNIYGTTYLGGAANAGVVYKLTPSGHETLLYSFTGGADGPNPYAGVILDSAGNLYGATYQGGSVPSGAGQERCRFRAGPLSRSGSGDSRCPSWLQLQLRHFIG
jgi:uncharacterized repeat protein (TIGR03803 family)